MSIDKPIKISKNVLSLYKTYLLLGRKITNMAKKINIEITTENEAAVVTFKATSISDAKGITSATKQIEEFIEGNHPNTIIFDFEQVKFFSSQVLGLLLNIRAKLRAYNGKVLISAIDPQLHRIFKITNLSRIFEFFPDKESAIKTIKTN